MPVIFSLIWAAAFLSGNTLSRIGVSMGPGVTALTRISRGSNSAASVRAKDRSAALAAPYASLTGHSLYVGDRGREDDSASPVDQRRELLHREKWSLGVQVEHLVVDGLGDALQRRSDAEPGVDGEQVEEYRTRPSPGRRGRRCLSTTARRSKPQWRALPISFCADSRPSFERPVTSTRAPPSSSIFAVASPMPLVPPIITAFLP